MSRRADLAAAVLGLLLLGYTTARASRIPITHDEAFTYLHFVDVPLRAALLMEGPEPTNDHVLNTLLMKGSAAAFGPSEPALRLPGLLAHASVLLFSWLLLRRAAPPAVALGAFALANANRLLLELLSLARGYGLSLGFVLPAIYLAARSLEREEGSLRHEWGAWALLALGVWAQLTALYPLAAVGALLLVAHSGRLRDEPLARRVASFARRLAPAAAAGVFLLAVLGPSLLRIVREGRFTFGGRAGLWHDTAGSLVFLSLFPAPGFDAAIPWAKAGLAILLAAIAATLPLSLRVGRPGPRRRVALALAALPLLAAGAVEALHLVGGMAFPTDRMAIFFVPLVGLGAGGAGSALAALGGRWSKASGAALAILGLGVSLHLLRVVDLSRSSLWWFDADAPRVLADLEALRRADGRAEPLRVGSISHCEPALNFYRRVDALYWLAPVERTRPGEGGYDYWYAIDEDEAGARSRGLVAVRRYERTGNALWRRPRPGDGAAGALTPAP